MKTKSTIKDVAKKAGVSTATVSYVLNNIPKVKPDTKEKVLNAIKSLNYSPSTIAQSLAKQQYKYIGLIVPFDNKLKRSILTDNPFFQEFISGVHYKCSELGFNTTFIGIDNEENFSSLIFSGELCGIIVLGYIGESYYSILSKLSIPVVLLDQERNEYSFIKLQSEDEKGAFLATEYLIDKGHKKLAFVSGEFKLSSIFKNRFSGFKKAINSHKLNFDSKFIFQETISYEDGFKLANTLKNITNNFSAIFCASDILALGIIKGLHYHGINVPDDISIVGFDDIKHSNFFIPSLTTVRQDVFGKGELAVQIILDNISPSKKNCDKTILYPVKFIERESVKDINEY